MKKLLMKKKNKREFENKYSFYRSDQDIEKEKFFQIPYALINKENFPTLKFEEAAIYGLLRDKISLSINQVDRFKDEHGRNYIIYKQEDLARDTSFTRKTVINYLNSLEKVGLIKVEKCKNQFVNQNRIYVKRYEDLLKDKEMNSDGFFYTENELEKHASIRVPFKLVKNEEFKDITFTEKCLYGLMLDRLKLSQKNKERYSDEDGNIYMIYTQQQLADKMHKSLKTIRTMLKNLEEKGLIVRKSMQIEGRGKGPDKIYLMNINTISHKGNNAHKKPINLCKSAEKKRLKPLKIYRMCKFYRTECVNFTYRNVKKLPIGMCKNDLTECEKFTFPNVEKLPTNTTKNNTTEFNTTELTQLTQSSQETERVSEENKPLYFGLNKSIVLRISEFNQLLKIYGEEINKVLEVADKAIESRSETADPIKHYFPYICKIAEKNGILTLEDKKRILEEAKRKAEEKEKQRKMNLEIYGTDDPDEIQAINNMAVSKSIEEWLKKHSAR